MSARCPASPTFLKHVVHIAPRGVHRRDDTGERSDRESEYYGEKQYARVNRRLEHFRHRRCWTQPSERPGEPLADQQPNQRARRGYQKTLGQKLTDDSRAWSSEGEANTKLLLTGNCACQKQICNIRAYDQKHDSARPHQDAEWSKQGLLDSVM